MEVDLEAINPTDPLNLNSLQVIEKVAEFRFFNTTSVPRGWGMDKTKHKNRS